MAPSEKYPIDALGPTIQSAFQALRRTIQAPDAVIAGALLAASSLAAQGLSDVTIDGRVYPISLWLVAVADSGDRKSAVDAEVMRALREYERELETDYTGGMHQEV